MKKFILIGCMCLGSILLGSCSKPVHSIEYYKQHEDERKVMLEKCKADPDLVMRDENCRSASSAEARSGANIFFSPPKNWTFGEASKNASEKPTEDAAPKSEERK
ncbi:EexN family lipoprotein [Xylella fastidiosa]|uniref:EexN family lipoprotein n=1 Tax=Xylella fastidiosa TaxID=2371 RepID=UPI001292F72F|nr:EexN family lipoprotein [Xylella fastidiosa]MBS9446453.1 EexN family lipoprotein [Xylella fastidiosa subsp. multiplex]MBS9448474.1 EexN family lipoprotein [Xylella fastidiosa subsp. multiplex]MBS9450482.1 EexN family lipoprotein [Xylella fastidiosa subsp. multiplex]MBS9452467.1 EexN family lipoprotein [Xylella fastidiosa subsp. multiplex]MBS9486802.1 EexN family lipoprotein [Xylella fastidiosa subsp. multiplex]